MGAASPREWDPSARRPYLFVFDGRCRAECALGVSHRSKLVGSARRSGPKLQARSAVSGEQGRQACRYIFHEYRNFYDICVDRFLIPAEMLLLS